MVADTEHAAPTSDHVWTLPNALSTLRLLGVPLFLYLLLGPQADGWAIVVLMVSGATDYLDGKLARVLNQTSKLGALLDPAADRLYVLSTLFAFVVRDVVPWWVAALIVGRDLVLLCTVPALRSRGLTVLPVHYLGKAATFCLLYAFPGLLIAQMDSWLATVLGPLAYALTVWGTAMYLWAGVLYLVQLRLVLRELPRVPWTWRP
ncbi:CDP-alcohol phosphatidyltransferase family protein [Rhodococcus sp. X156]|uniref:CDP-alcohol phosphatidyltransferase family protein n=1 Tax=Rhodococcus sp. X156 TaxID=2499145 RepID=UPI000FD92336|nr:CDP-alcohol phosphatidyltransferase family protein [Rhodococcus sp. X156]